MAKKNNTLKIDTDVVFRFGKEQQQLLAAEIAKLQVLQQQAQEQNNVVKTMITMAYPEFANSKNLVVDAVEGVIRKAPKD